MPPPASQHAAARDLYHACAPALVLYARTWLPASDAEDLVQEAFVRLMSSQNVRPAEPRPWLFRVVRNLAITRLRKARRGGVTPLTAEPAIIGEAGSLVDAQEVNRALQDLPEHEREVLVLRLWADMTLEEVGRLTETSTATAFRNYQRALSAVRARLEKPCPTNPTNPTNPTPTPAIKS
jgi:RNA polymerase sigma-70 factor (ECF subfamily)